MRIQIDIETDPTSVIDEVNVRFGGRIKATRSASGLWLENVRIADLGALGQIFERWSAPDRFDAAEALREAEDERLRNHPMFSLSDLKYFRRKGYTDEEVLMLWDRDHAAGKGPVKHRVTPSGVCPRCGEDDPDELVWDDAGERVTCQRCGTKYTVHPIT